MERFQNAPAAPGRLPAGCKSLLGQPVHTCWHAAVLSWQHYASCRAQAALLCCRLAAHCHQKSSVTPQRECPALHTYAVFLFIQQELGGSPAHSAGCGGVKSAQAQRSGPFAAAYSLLTAVRSTEGPWLLRARRLVKGQVITASPCALPPVLLMRLFVQCSEPVGVAQSFRQGAKNFALTSMPSMLLLPQSQRLRVRGFLSCGLSRFFGIQTRVCGWTAISRRAMML